MAEAPPDPSQFRHFFYNFGVTEILFGGPIGIGTILIALFLWQMIHYTLPKCRRFLLKIIDEQEIKVLL
ncbi:hypothetical protein [Sporosarcina psychrophila]|uniref:hypothetical protein n=1 Tax=Sporosarcina TaxID=1569 RepID=UPI0030CC6BFF